MLSAHFENFLFLLLLVVAALFQLLARVARKPDTADPDETTESPPPNSKPIPRAGPQSDQERVRKFLEALGNPTAASPPPRTARRPTNRKPLVLRRIPPLASPLPPLVSRPPDLHREFEVHREATPVPVQRTRVPQRPTQAVFQVHESTASPAATPTPPSALPQETTAQSQVVVPPRAILAAAFLRSKGNLREAIVIREILGPPRGMQAPDFL